MKRLPIFVFVVLLASLCAFAFPPGVDERPDGLTQASKELAALKGRVSKLEERLARLEVTVRGESPGEPAPPEPPPPRPPRPDPPAPELPPDVVWPDAQTVQVELRRARLRPEVLALPPPTEWDLGAQARHATTWATLADLHVRAFWDQTTRGDSYVSVQVVNGYADVGVVELAGARVLVDGEPLETWGAETLIPRVALPWATTWPADASGWNWIDDPRPYPEWTEERARQEIADRARNRFRIWPFWWHDQHSDGSRSPRRPGSPAGYGVAPFDGGSGDYLTGPWGKAARWAWTLGESWKGIWFLDRETGQPALRTGVEYWTGRENQRWMDLALEGYGYKPHGALQEQLEDECRPEDGPHLRRIWGGASAIAPWCGPGRWVMRMAAYDVMQDWLLDDEQGREGSILTGGLSRRIQQASNGSLVPPKSSGILGSRYLAQAVYCLAEAEPYLEPELFDRYARGLITFGALITSPDGVCNRDTSGDTGQYTGAPWNLRGPLVSTFHQRLVCGAYGRLAELGYDGADELSRRMAGFLGTAPTPYAVEAWQLGVPGNRWQERKHSAATSLPAGQRRWSPDGGSYASFTHGILAGWPSLEAMDRAARQGPSELSPYAVVPREVWEELWR